MHPDSAAPFPVGVVSHYTKGYRVESVLVNGVDVTASVVNGSYTIPSVSRDIEIAVTFRARSAGEEVSAVDVAGKVYQEDDLLPGAEVNLDFGTVKAVSGQDGSYLLESLEDGRHYVEILVDGKVVGRTQFVLQAADVNETVVDTLSDGTQRVQYPKGTVKVYLTLSSMRMEVSPFARVKSPRHRPLLPRMYSRRFRIWATRS